jgi:hypothetical protein
VVGLAVDAAGNIYLADQNNNRVRKVDTNGVITTFAGTGVAGFSGDGGPAAQAELNGPLGVCVAPSGRHLRERRGQWESARNLDLRGPLRRWPGTDRQ